jgi:hypothetical protein
MTSMARVMPHRCGVRDVSARDATDLFGKPRKRFSISTKMKPQVRAHFFGNHSRDAEDHAQALAVVNKPQRYRRVKIVDATHCKCNPFSKAST